MWLSCSHFSILCHLQSPHGNTFLMFYKRSRTGSNDPLPLQVVHTAPLLEDIGCLESIEHTVQTPWKKCAIKKKLTPRRATLVHPAQLQIPKARRNSSLNKVWFLTVILRIVVMKHHFLLACLVLMVWRNYFFCCDIL